MVDKGKEKADSRLSSVWDDVSLALTRAHDAFTAKELKVFFGVPSNKIVGRHIHKLDQVKYLYHLLFPSFLFIFLYGSKSWMLCVIFFSSATGNHPYNIGVLEPGGKGHVSVVQGAGFRGGKFEAEEGSHFCHG